MEANDDNPSRANRYLMDGVHKTNIIEWNKKRKLQTDQLDMIRPKHKCWIRSFPSEHVSMFGENTQLKIAHVHMVNGQTDAAGLDDKSEPESFKDSNSFAEDSDTSMSVNEEAKLEQDYGKASTFKTRNDNIFEDKHEYFDGSSSAEKTRCSEEEVDFVDNAYHQSYHDADLQALKNLEENIRLFGNHTDHLTSEYAKDGTIDKEFEDILRSNGVNPNIYVLSSGRWDLNQEAQSSARPPTIDQEFEQYFSTLML